MCYNISTVRERQELTLPNKKWVATNARKRHKMANEVKEITMREFFEAVTKNEITDRVIAKAEAEIAKLDERNEKRKGENSKRAKENAPIIEAIVNYLTENKGVKVASVIAKALDLSTAKVSSLCGKLVAEGKVKVSKVKEKGKSPVNGYEIA